MAVNGSYVKLQLNTPASITRDLKVEMTNQVTGEKRTATPYLDGTVTLPNVAAGPWRVQVKHPNLIFDAFDRPIKVLPDRPTITPILIPRTIFENVPIEDIPDADLGPVQQHLDEAALAAEQQAVKKAGQPIYADDWNELAQTVGSVSKAAKEMSSLLSPRGHNHPELEAKLDEVQRNLQRMFDSFGASLAQFQRQIQQLALRSKLDAALDRIPAVDENTRVRLTASIQDLETSWSDAPGVYGAIKRRAGQQVLEQFSELLASQTPEVRDQTEVRDLQEFTQAMSSEAPVRTYEEEVQQQQRTGSKSTSGLVFDALKVRQRG
ncbi:MAG: hypothetical protein WD696_11945 [Bryobacteraceae bacterium]